MPLYEGNAGLKNVVAEEKEVGEAATNELGL